ncbi:MAG: Cof-type HAD-IIB family hydrolase [Bacillota bacterium]|jgi:Cof subfamily protein (haloacid dehalogenase superfamily)
MGTGKQRIRLVACDIDGTLIGPGGHGIDVARQALDFCRKRGIRVTAATGRAFGAAEKYLEALGLDEPAITNGGALIARIGEPPIYEKTIDRGVAQNIALDLKKLGYPFYFLVGKHMYTDVKGPETARYSEVLGYVIRTVDSTREIQGHPTQIVLRVPPEKADRILSELHSRWQPKIAVLKSLPHLLEIQPPGVSKAKALEFLAGSMDIYRNEVLSIGDGLNDLDMLMWSGMKAAVKNAHELVKRNVPYVSGHEFAEGVLEIVEKFIR